MPFLLPSQVPADAREPHLVALDESQSTLDNIQIISGYYPDHIWIISEVWIPSEAPRGLLDFLYQDDLDFIRTLSSRLSKRLSGSHWNAV